MPQKDELRSLEVVTMDGGSAQVAGAAGGFGQRVLSGSFLPFPLAPVRQVGAKSGIQVGDAWARLDGLLWLLDPAHEGEVMTLPLARLTWIKFFRRAHGN